MSDYCGRHGCNFPKGRTCPECVLEREAEDRQNTQEILDQIREEMAGNQIDAADLAWHINNSGKYECPECGRVSLMYNRKRCPVCHAGISPDYWTEVDEKERIKAEKEKARKEEQARLEKEAQRKKEETERIAQRKRDEATDSENRIWGCFVLVVIFFAACMILYQWFTGGFETKNQPSTQVKSKPVGGKNTENVYIPPPSTTQEKKTEALPIPPKEPERFFTLGSTMGEVLSIQGKPSFAWYWKPGQSDYPEQDSWSYSGYRTSTVSFDHGRVVNWMGWTDNPLKAKIVPSGSVDETLQFFTVGSTMDEVLFVQGQPLSVSSQVASDQTPEEKASGAETILTTWTFGNHTEVHFRDNKVTHWDKYNWDHDGILLKARLVPKTVVDPNLTFFTIGSTRNEVLAIQGQPDNPFNFQWRYGDSVVTFSQNSDEDKVIRWTNSNKNTLKAKIIPSGPVDETLQFFTVGSTMDEVLFVQGQPDSINPYAKTDTWTYGSSSIYFENRRVVRWTGNPIISPLKAKPKKTNLPF